MSGDRLPSKNPAIRGDPIAPYDREWGPNKEARNFHFPNDVVTIVPKSSDRASLPPPGYLSISETNLRAGLRFPPPAELIEILRQSGVNLSQFSLRAMSVTVGLIMLFRDRGATLTPEHLLRMGQFTSNMHGHVTFKSKWLDLRTRDPSKNWANAFFFVKNDWGLLEKWGKIKDLPAPLHVQEEDIMRILKVPDIEHLLFEVGLSFHARRSDASTDKRSQTLIAEKEAALSGSEPSKVIEDFKKSIAFKTIIQDHVQEARDHIYDIEVKALEQQCIDDGFIRGFLKGRKTGVQVEGVTPGQASDDFPSGFDGDEIESELQKAFDLDVDDETVNIE
ncbi:hypothetical protein IEQ34_016682 [Dendrobium chrysotoxum]|uniref:Uncharacterized protein n=1 Tax=Dendrobium chrysotoxum TaxID=161865 RepID=A0AAV7GH66_DENCH|nr:hypothetical protein IEQ34_016682 [Dendrobium chrysotoxum]